MWIVALPVSAWTEIAGGAKILRMPTKKPRPQFPNNLRALRKARGLKLRQVAEALGTTEATISRRESGERQGDQMARSLRSCHEATRITANPSSVGPAISAIALHSGQRHA